MLQSDQPLPKVAIFCDGWKFHASPAHNRIADDAQKRRDLRDAGNVVLGVTWEDLENEVRAPTWFSEPVAQVIKANTAAGLDGATVALASAGPVDQVVAWIDRPDPDQWRRLADWLPMFLVGQSPQAGVPDEADLGAVALSLVDGDSLGTDGLKAWSWRIGSVAVVARSKSETNVEVAVVLDDRDEVLGQEYRNQWREWLRTLEPAQPAESSHHGHVSIARWNQSRRNLDRRCRRPPRLGGRLRAGDRP